MKTYQREKTRRHKMIDLKIAYSAILITITLGMTLPLATPAIAVSSTYANRELGIFNNIHISATHPTSNKDASTFSEGSVKSDPYRTMADTIPATTSLAASDGAAYDQFGKSVSISGDTGLVGAWGDNSNTGAAYVFLRSGTSWSQQAKLTATDATSTDQFGWSVAIDADTAVIGAPFDNSNTGAVYVFTRSGTTWSQQTKLTADDAFSRDFFGWSVAISGNTIIVGAYGKAGYTGQPMSSSAPARPGASRLNYPQLMPRLATNLAFLLP